MAKQPKPEAAFMDAVAEYARTNGWLVAHFTAGKTMSGRAFLTAARYDGSGFPDLTMVRRNRIVFAELKRKGVRSVSAGQQVWARALIGLEDDNPGVEYHLWNPIDWDKIERTLKR